MSYINIPIVTDTDVLIQQALFSIAQNIPGWVPREGNLEVLLVEQFAAMAAEAANVASDVPASIFTYFGSLVGITPNPGASAEIQTTWTLVNNAPTGGYAIPAGTVAGFFYGGAAYQFQTLQDEIIAAGTNTLSITMQAVGVGSVYNIQDLANFNPLATYLQMQSQDPNISSILITATSATDTSLTYGVDPETTTNFLNRLTAELQLLAPRPITPSDYALFSQNIAGVYRAQAFDGFNPLTNRFSTADANLLTASTVTTSGLTSLTVGTSPWTTFGNGTASLPTINTPGTSPANYLQFTSSSTAPLSGIAVQAATSAGATSITAVVGSGSFSTTISPTNPAMILISDATNGNEIAIVTAAAAKSGSNQTLTIASPGLSYAHSTSATITQLQGVAAPVVSSLAANENWYQAATILEAGTATTATEKPYVVSVATYVDGSVQVYSSAPKFDDSLYSYTSGTKTIVCDILASNPNSVNPLAYDSNVTTTYQNIKPYIVSIQNYIAFATTETSKTHKIFYNSVNQVQLDLTSANNPTTATSDYNFIPDATFSNYLYTNGGSASWTNPSGTTILPDYGVQYVGTGSALGSSLTVASQIFNLSHLSSDVPSSTTRQYTLFANVDASQTGATYGDVTVEIIDLSTGAVLSPASGTATISPTSAVAGTLVANFTLSSPKDVQVKIIFGSGLNVPVGSSVIVSNVGIISGGYTIYTLPSYGQYNYFWTPGGLYNPNTFNYARTVTVAPIDVNGLPVSTTIDAELIAYLESRREVNFTVNTINPNYVPIDIEYSVYVAPTYSSATVESLINSALRSYLSPASWGGGNNTPPYWDGSSTTVRVMDIAAIIGSTPGVYSVVSVQTRTSYPTSGAYSTSDITMSGVAPLPIANTITGTVFTNSNNAYSGLG